MRIVLENILTGRLCLAQLFLGAVTITASYTLKDWAQLTAHVVTAIYFATATIIAIRNRHHRRKPREK